MAFDSTTRNKLARMVADCRRLLAEEFTKQCQEIYGIQPDGQITPIDKLTHLDDEQHTTAALLRERIDHLVSGLTTEKQPMVTAIDRMIREQSFTVLNRFAALRMAEEREFVSECVRASYQSKGFQVFLTVAGTSLGETYARYGVFLYNLFDELSLDLCALFDRFSPFGLLFPREPALLELLKTINHGELNQLWIEDETIGWIYQYFNSKEEREKMRKESAAPRNSRELAVRNQFFTPRYVVEFLTDNTLGRIWYEMTQGKTTLAADLHGLNTNEKTGGICRYLVRRPNEIFLKEGARPPDTPPEIAHGSHESPEYSPLEGGSGDSCRGMSPAALGAKELSSENSPLANGTARLSSDNSPLEKGDRGLSDGGKGAQPGSADPDSGSAAFRNNVNPALASPGKSQEDLLKEPVYIPFRTLKDPREIRMLDPACGSMHFGLYAFDLFEIIYEEAWDRYPELLKDLRGTGNSPLEGVRQASLADRVSCEVLTM